MVVKFGVLTTVLKIVNHLNFFAVLLYTLLTSELFASKICSKDLIVANCILPLKGYLFLLEKLFDTLVVLIILYGCDIWGVDHCFKDSEPFEHLHIKFIKEILGVHYKATNAACLAELNRFYRLN
jgi:hypothetical protein